VRVLFIHRNAPGQFVHLAPHLAKDPANRVVFLGERGGDRTSSGVRWVSYPPPQPPNPATHHYLHRTEASVRRGQAAARVCQDLVSEGFEPDVIVAHAGWGETMFVRDVLSRSAILSYCEMFYRADGQDSDFIPETMLDLDGRCRLRVWNADLLMALNAMDRGIAPTEWQRAQHPTLFHSRISVVHDGVDTTSVCPNPNARLHLADGRVLTPDDEVVSFVARNLEPVRGFTALMHALPDLLRRRPRAQVVICGGLGVSYGRPPSNGANWREVMMREISVDPARVHFTGLLARMDYLALLQVSTLHLYLTVPFVLSWSCVEAMAAGCLLLASDVAPVREVLEHRFNGFLVDARDPAALASSAADLLAHRASLKAVRQRARDCAVQRFDLRLCLARQSRIVRDLAG
jgi:glycosyltransferase involved in cell wall biosynthesis